MTPDSSHFDTIICIGAGPGDQVDAWLATGVTRIILVEPNPAHRPALTALAAAHPAVEVTRAAIAAHDGKGVLHVFNLARHSSLRSPGVLTDLLPGLRPVAEVSVPTLSTESFLASLGDLPGKVALFLDAPGSEAEVLHGFAAAGALTKLSAIDLICTEVALYHGATPRAALQTLLEQAGFALTAADLTDPDWPHLSFHLDQQARLITDLTTRLHDTSATARLLEDHLALQTAVTEALTLDHADDLRALQQQLDAAKATCTLHDLALAGAAARDATHQQDLADLRHALTAAQTEAAARSEFVQRQAARITELEFRQTQAREELRRFEGQMDLIKDLLLRGERL